MVSIRPGVHIVVGLTVAAYLPGVLGRALRGDWLPVVLAGIAAVMPDFLDTFFALPLLKRKIVIAPDPLNPRPRKLPEQVAAAANELAVRGQGVLHLAAIPVDWATVRAYHVRFERHPARVRVRVDAVATPDKPARPKAKWYSATLLSPLRMRDGQAMSIDRAEGTDILIKRDKWHKLRGVECPARGGWTHSILLWGLIAVVVWPLSAAAAISLFAGAGSHLALSQAGERGCALLFPFRRERIPGSGRLSARHPRTRNGVVVVAAALLLCRLLDISLGSPCLGPVLTGALCYGWVISAATS